MIRHVSSPTRKQRVDFYGNKQDFLCYAFASTGIATDGIKQALASIGIHLTLGQIQYRILKAEDGRKSGEATQRQMYRQGKSSISQSLITQIVGNRGLGQKVKKNIVERLEVRGKYIPQPKGVLK